MRKKHCNVYEGDTLKGVRRNKTAALALAISLWLTGGGVASAGDIYIDADDDNKVVVNYSSPDKVPTDAIIDPGNGTPGVTSLTIGSNNPKGSDWSEARDWTFNGGKDT